MTEQPIVCSLSVRAYAERLGLIRRVGSTALVRVDRRPARVVLHFRPGDQIARDLREIRDAEAQCCAFLSLELTEPTDATVLSIASANPDGAFMIDELADAFAANASLQG
ncbi:MAG: hypothetical protein QOH00_2321 [Gaiellales bacterium]|jgi:hypothetical protein|nr:hypothetical protein [Gaiellales bacterium]